MVTVTPASFNDWTMALDKGEELFFSKKINRML
jgi:hypothetical protein